MVLLQYKVTPFWRQKLAPITLAFNILVLITSVLGCTAVLSAQIWLKPVIEATKFLLTTAEPAKGSGEKLGPRDWIVHNYFVLFTLTFVLTSVYQSVAWLIPYNMATPKRRSLFGPCWSLITGLCVFLSTTVVLFNYSLAFYLTFFFRDDFRGNLGLGMGKAIQHHFQGYRGPLGDEPARMSPFTPQIQQLQFRFQCCGDWHGWKSYKHLRTAEFSHYDPAYVFVDKLPSCCRHNPTPMSDCPHDVGSPTSDLEPEAPEDIQQLDSLFYTVGCAERVTARFDVFLTLVNVLMALVAILKTVEVSCTQYLWSSLMTAHKIYGDQPVIGDDFGDSPGYLVNIPILGEPPELDAYEN